MRKLVLLAPCLFLPLLSSCQRNKPAPPVVDAAPESPALQSAVHVADPQATAQLLSGFHQLEQNAWRWTMQRFTVSLATPEGAAAKGATLNLKFAVPEPVLQKLGPLSISAKVNGVALSAQRFPTAGDAEYTETVPAAALKGESSTVEFSLDKALPAGAVDKRELGIVVTQISHASR